MAKNIKAVAQASTVVGMSKKYKKSLENEMRIKALRLTSESERKNNNLLTVTFVMASALRLMFEELCDSTTGMDERFREDSKKAYKKIAANVTECVNLHDNVIEPYIQRCLSEKDKESGKVVYDVESYQSHQMDANEACRLMLLYWDRCFNNFDNVNKAFASIRELPSCGIFSEEDIERYRLKKL